MKIVWLGRLKPELEQELEVSEPVYMFELDLVQLETSKRPVLTPASAFPASLRDISLLVPNDKDSDAVAADIRSVMADVAGAGLLDSLRLFDVYEGKGILEGFRNQAYSLQYRSSECTLKDEEVETIHGRVREGLKQKGHNIR